MIVVPYYAGLICIVISIASYGVLSVPMKVKYVINTEFIFLQFFMSFMIMLGLLPIYFFLDEIKMIVYAVVSALIWTIASFLSIIIVRLIGISIGQSLWSGTTMITSFLFGILIFKEKFNNLTLVIIGLCILIIGTLSISLTNLNFELLKKLCKSVNTNNNNTNYAKDYIIINDENQKDKIQYNNNTNYIIINELENTNTNTNTNTKEKQQQQKIKNLIKYIIGVTLSILMGIFNSSSMVFIKYDNSLYFLFTFGISQFFITSGFVILYLIINTFISYKNIKSYKKRDILYNFISGSICGIIWLCGYYSSFFAILSKFGMSIGFVLIQTTIIPSTLIGMFFFKEIPGLYRKLYLGGCIFFVLIGACLLFYFGK